MAFHRTNHFSRQLSQNNDTEVIFKHIYVRFPQTSHFSTFYIRQSGFRIIIVQYGLSKFEIVILYILILRIKWSYLILKTFHRC